MELTLVNIVSKLIVLLFKSFYSDTKSCVTSVRFFLQTIPKIFSTKWDFFWRKVELSRNSWCDEPSNQELNPIDETLEGERRISNAEINLMMNRMGMEDELEDCGNNTSFGEEEFSSLFDEKEPSLEEIMEAFEVFDVNKDGFIDASELQRVICNLGLKEGCGLEDCKGMIRAFDGNGDGLIDFRDFVKFMERCLC